MNPKAPGNIADTMSLTDGERSELPSGVSPEPDEAANGNSLDFGPTVTAGSPPAADPEKSDAAPASPYTSFSLPLAVPFSDSGANRGQAELGEDEGRSVTQTSGQQQPADPDRVQNWDTAPSLHVPPPIAFTSWERYEILDCLGLGGMGIVYRARDPRLDRLVALKFLRGRNLPAAVIERFYREARAQARVEHDHVCKIYEVGEAHGVPYIAMQYIHGESLRKTARKALPTEQRVELTRQIALGLHAAHRQSLIHRDVKPANIMVESGPDGSLRAYVMDFGIAAEHAPADADIEVRIEGTPAYMSPEQARGEARSLDRRSDVYSLGATCYELLTEQPPFTARNTARMLWAVQTEQPRPIHAIRPHIPIDLEMIVMKCMEKEPAERYSSAMAVAEELQRYLNGEPVLVRQSNWLYRLRMRARKHKFMMSVVLASSLAGLFAIGFGIRAQIQAKRATEIAQKIGQDAERIETLMRYSYSMPIHDIEREQTLILRELDQLSSRMRADGPLAKGPTLYAIGRGHLVMHDYEQAYHYLTQAVEQGYLTPEVHYALGRTLGEIYKEALAEARKISNSEARAKQIRMVELRYREPALAHLKSTGGLRAEANEYAQGLIAFYSQRYEEALAKARQAESQTPWMYETKQLQADVYTALGNALRFQGQFKDAVQNYQKAVVLYQQAGEIARSDSQIHESEARTWSILAEVGYLQGRVEQGLIARGLEACDRAIASNPRSGKAYERKAHLLLRKVRHQFREGEDLSTSAATALELAQHAASLAPHDGYPLAIMANVYNIQAEDELRRGSNPVPVLNKAIAILRKIIEIDPSWDQAYNMLSSSLTALGLAMGSHGQDARDALTQAAAIARQGIAISPDFNLTQVELLFAYAQRAMYDATYGGDPEPAATAAISYAEANQPSLDNIYGTHQALALAQLAKAIATLDMDVDPQAELAAGLAQTERALKLNDQESEIFATKALAHRLIAQHHLNSGMSPLAELELLRKSAEQGLKLNAYESSLYSEQVRGEIILAKWLARSPHAQGERSARAQALEKAEAFIQQAAAHRILGAEMQSLAADIYRLRVEAQTKRTDDTPAILQAGLASVERALRINSKLPEALAIRGVLLLLQARNATRAEAVWAAQEALLSFESARSVNPRLRNRYGEYQREAAALIALSK